MKGKKEEIKKRSYFSLCLSHCIFFCDILLIVQSIIQITQLGIITLYTLALLHFILSTFFSLYRVITPNCVIWMINWRIKRISQKNMQWLKQRLKYELFLISSFLSFILQSSRRFLFLKIYLENPKLHFDSSVFPFL